MILLKTWWPALLVIAMGLLIHLYAERQADKAVTTEKLTTENTVLKGAAEKRTIDAKNLQKIRRLDDDALVRRYCRWVYTIPYDECVRTTVPVE